MENKPPVLVRDYHHPEDESAAWDLHVAAFKSLQSDIYKYGEDGWDASFRQLPRACQQAGGVFLLAEEGRQLVAMIGLLPTGPGEGELVLLRVSPSRQGMGLGRAMLMRAEDEARRLGISKLSFKAASFQTAARHLYAKTGYFEVRREAVAWSDKGIQDIFFEKTLLPRRTFYVKKSSSR